jgi:hypothetical protein
MFGSLGGERVDLPITEFFAMADGSPADVDGGYRARIVAVTRWATLRRFSSMRSATGERCHSSTSSHCPASPAGG